MALGELNGGADGVFGPATASAVGNFQEHNGLPVTGVINLRTYFLIREKEDGREPVSVSYPPVYTVEDKFANILADVADRETLEKYVTPKFSYRYDAFEGEGLISTGTVLGTYEDASRPIDTIRIIVTPEVKVQREENGVISVLPVFRVSSIGAYRPYVKNLILKVGNAVREIEAAAVKGALTGTEVTETADLLIPVEKLKDLTGDGELEVRLRGNSREYDLAVSAAVADVLEAIGE